MTMFSPTCAIASTPYSTRSRTPTAGVTNRVTPGKIILGELGAIETGVRQMIRTRPLEVSEVALPSGRTLRIPILEEILRVNAYRIVRRNQTRDFLDIAALTDRLGTDRAAGALVGMDMDAYYADQHGMGDGVASQVARRLGEPRPKNARTTRELPRYKRLDPRWHDLRTVIAACAEVAEQMVILLASDP